MTGGGDVLRDRDGPGDRTDRDAFEGRSRPTRGGCAAPRRSGTATGQRLHGLLRQKSAAGHHAFGITAGGLDIERSASTSG